MSLEHIVKHTCRFNIKNPQHRKVNEVLAGLSPDVCKSKSQFLIDASYIFVMFSTLQTVMKVAILGSVAFVSHLEIAFAERLMPSSCNNSANIGWDNFIFFLLEEMISPIFLINSPRF